MTEEPRNPENSTEVDNDYDLQYEGDDRLPLPYDDLFDPSGSLVPPVSVLDDPFVD